MGIFVGSKLEFKKYFGGYCRNKVHEITNQYRKSHNGICEYCKNKSELQAAHIQGFERIKLIESILEENYKTEDGKFSVELDDFENKFIKAHQPIDKHFHFLCSKCHSKYDSSLLSEFEISRVKDDSYKKLDIVKSEEILQPNNEIKIINNGLYKNENESVQDYVKRLLNILFSNHLLSEDLVYQLQNKAYCKAAFDINYPLLEQDASKIKPAGKSRYYTTFKLQNKYYVCKEWWKDNFPVYEKKLKEWVDKISKAL